LPVSAVDCVQPAIQHTREQLFKHFHFGQWARLALVGILAAEVQSGGCSAPNFSNFNIPITPPRKSGEEFLPPNFPHIDPAHLGQLLGLIGVALLLAAVVILIFLYLNSVFRFILFDSVLRRQCSIGDGWHRWRRAGGRFFWWQLVFQTVALVYIVILVGIPLAIAFAAGWFDHARERPAPLIIGGVLLVLLAIASVLAMAAIQLAARDFLVPIMAFEGLGFGDGWNRLLPIISREKGKFFVYLLMKIVLSLAAAIVFGILAIIPMLIVAVPAVGAVVIGYYAGLRWDAVTISLTVILGSMLFVILIYLIALVSVPGTVFFPAFSIYFFAPRYPRLAAILYPAPPPAPAPQSPPIPEPPPEPPPLPPIPETAV
jgi:hypothetical protein